MAEDKFGIKSRLKKLQDIKYREFNIKLIPGIDNMKMLGVRVPELRKIAREIKKTDYCGDFLKELPHEYFEENGPH